MNPDVSRLLFDDELRLRCGECDAGYPFSAEWRGCPECAGTLHVVVPTTWFRDRVAAGTGGGQATAFPEAATAETFGDGSTPLRPAPALAAATGAAEVWIKDETRNPTGSFKDRLNATATAAIGALGGDRVVASSTGNQAVSAVWFARRRGLRARAFLPVEVPGTAARVVRIYGGEAEVVPWTERSGHVRALVDEGWSYLGRNAPRPLANPYGIEGYKSIAVEIVAALGTVPDVVVMPACGGDGIAGLIRGFLALRASGVVDAVPHIVAVQPESCPSLVRALDAGATTVAATPLGETIAHSLRDERAGDHALWAMNAVGGTAVTVTDDELRSAMGSLGRLGVFAEPAGAAALAGLPAALASVPAPSAAARVVIVATGSGDRWPASLEATTEGSA